MTSIGAVFRPQFAPETLRDVALAGEAAGLEQLWLWEDCFLSSGLAPAAAVLAWTERLRVGIGLMPVALRNVALTAMEIATLERMFPGRFIAGFGHGVQDWMGQAGARVSSPMTLLREQGEALGRLLAGENVTTAGRYVTLTDVELAWPPTTPVHLASGGVGPRTLALAGELVDAVILTSGIPPQKLAASRALIEETRAALGRTAPLNLIAYVAAAFGPDAGDRMAADRAKRESNPADVHGEPAEVAEALAGWVAAGVDTIVLEPTPDEPDPVAFARAAAEVGRLVA